MYTLQTNLAKLKEIAKLKKNWGGYGEKPIPKAVIKDTKHILEGLGDLPQPFIAPTADGEIQIEWEKEDGLYLEIIVSDRDEGWHDVWFAQYRYYFDDYDYAMGGTVMGSNECINNLVKRCFVDAKV